MHLMCQPCRIRIVAANDLPVAAEHPCPLCGAQLEAVAELSELLGYARCTATATMHRDRAPDAAEARLPVPGAYEGNDHGDPGRAAPHLEERYRRPDLPH